MKSDKRDFRGLKRWRRWGLKRDTVQQQAKDSGGVFSKGIGGIKEEKIESDSGNQSCKGEERFGRRNYTTKGQGI